MRLPILILTLFACSIALAQGSGNIVGRVIDAETGDPIMNVNVKVRGIGVGDVTDSEGRYEIGILPFGLYQLEASHIGYESKTVSFQISGGRLEQEFRLTPRMLASSEVIITADRASESASPITFSNIPETILDKERLAGDATMLIQNIVPGVYSYSEAGNGLGYTHLSIRGFDQKRVNVMINGIPLNDPEDHQVYWVDMPELMLNLQDIQVQRGVGSALFGQHGIGGSVNMATATLPGESGMAVSANLGSWGTRRISFKLSSASNENRSMYARFSRVLSDGYRDRTSSDLWSYFFSGQALHRNMTFRLNAYGGPIKTQAGWYASHEDSLEINRRHNPVTYDNEIDNFNQPHYELHFSMAHSPQTTIGASLFYIRGTGYYEQEKYDRRLRDYGIVPVADDSTRADLIRQKHVKKHHVGFIPRIDWNRGWFDASAGAELSFFRSRHRGDLVLVDYGDSVYGNYYKYRGEKVWGSVFLHALTHFGDDVDLLTDFSLQTKRYSQEQLEAGNFQGPYLNRFEDSFTFFSPRVGITVRPNEKLTAYASVSTASREPADHDYWDVWEGPDDLLAVPLFATPDTIRSGSGDISYIDWTDPQVDPEEVVDYEAGVRLVHGDLKAAVALYLMKFKNEIVPYGRFDYDRGQPVTGNAPRTEHAGIEIEFGLPPLDVPAGNLLLGGTASFSRNEFEEFTSHEDWSETGEDLSGNPIPLFPNRMVRTQLSYLTSRWDIGVRYKSIGKQYLDTSGDEDRIIDAHTLLDAWIRIGPYQLGSGGRGSLEFRVENLADVEYETSGYYDSWEGARYYWVGAERTFYAGIYLEL